MGYIAQKWTAKPTWKKFDTGKETKIKWCFSKSKLLNKNYYTHLRALYDIYQTVPLLSFDSSENIYEGFCFIQHLKISDYETIEFQFQFRISRTWSTLLYFWIINPKLLRGTYQICLFFRYTQKMLMEEMDDLGLEGRYDFFYLPRDRRAGTNVPHFRNDLSATLLLNQDAHLRIWNFFLNSLK